MGFFQLRRNSVLAMLAGIEQTVSISFFRVEFTTIPSLTNRFWTPGCLSFRRVLVEFVPLYGAWEEWLASARVGLLHYSTGFFFFPGLPWIMFFPYKFHLTAVYIETTQLWSAQGKKNYNAIKSYHKFQISITSNPIHNFTASIKWVICSGLRRLLERFTSF